LAGQGYAKTDYFARSDRSTCDRCIVFPASSPVDAFFANQAEEVKKGVVTMNHDRILFTRFQGNAEEIFNDIYACDPDGRNEVRLTTNPGANGEYSDNAAPRYNKEKTMIAFVSTKKNPNKLYNIFFLDLATGKTAQITEGSLDISSVDWSPDDSHLVFSCKDDGRLPQIHLVKLDGSGFTKLTSGPEENMNPLWSPRGDLIVFTQFARDSKTAQIWLMDPAGGNRKQLTTDDAAHANPSWSPDGAWVIFRCDTGRPHLRRINVDTGEVFLYKAPASGADSSPIWSQGGIVFSSNRDWEEADSLFNLYTMYETGENVQRITTSQAFEYCGDW
jgi:Tol biopolymer transport system component